MEENHCYRGISHELRKARHFFFFHNAKMNAREKLSYDAYTFPDKS